MSSNSPRAPGTSETSEVLKRLKWVFAGLAVFSFFVSMLMLTGPLYMLQVYDRVLASGSIPTLIALTILVLGLYAALGVLEWVRNSVFASVGSRFEDELADRALDISLSESLADPGKRQTKALQHLRVIRRFVVSPALPAFFDAPWTPVFFAALFLMHWIYGAWAIFGALVLIALTIMNQAITGKSIAGAADGERATQAAADELSRNVEVIDALGMRQALVRKWRSGLDETDSASVRSSRSGAAFTSGTKAFRLFLQSAVLGLGAWLSIIGQSTPGAMIAASIILGRAIAPIEQCVGQWRSIVSARRSWSALSEALEAHPPQEARMRLPDIKGALRVESLSAGPPRANKPFLRGLDFRLQPGQALGVIGPSAAGKSTLTMLLTGTWSSLSGKIRLDGADLSAWNSDALGPQLGFLPQRVNLFSGTIRENIARFQEDAQPEAVIEAAMAAGCHEMILSLPDAYDTEIGSGGAYLSAGQQQRVGLARALYGNPNFIVLDEPNANLDSAGEEALQAALTGVKQRQATVVIVSHRPAILSQCDCLLVLDQGEQRLFGPRQEVMTRLVELRQQASGQVTPIRQDGTHG